LNAHLSKENKIKVYIPPLYDSQGNKMPASAMKMPFPISFEDFRKVLFVEHNDKLSFGDFPNLYLVYNGEGDIITGETMDMGKYGAMLIGGYDSRGGYTFEFYNPIDTPNAGITIIFQGNARGEFKNGREIIYVEPSDFSIIKRKYTVVIDPTVSLVLDKMKAKVFGIIGALDGTSYNDKENIITNKTSPLGVSTFEYTDLDKGISLDYLAAFDFSDN